jgi:hypothetical protein
MKYFLLSIAVIIGSGLLFGKLASDFVDQEQHNRKEIYCKQLGTWHPDCKVE